MYGNTSVDPEHATQLHAVASTPSLGSTGHFCEDDRHQFSSFDEEEDGPNELQLIPQHVSQNGSLPSGFRPNGFPPNGFPPNGFPPNGFPPNGFQSNGFPPNGFPSNGFVPQQHGSTAHVSIDSLDSPGSTIASPAYVSARPDHTSAVQSDLGKPRKGMPRVPSFPIIASGTPITPIMIPAEGAPQDSRAVFSPHQPSSARVHHLAPTSTAEPSRASANPSPTLMQNGLSTAPQKSPPGNSTAEVRFAAPNGTHTLSAEELGPPELGMRSLSLGGLSNRPLGVTRGLSSPADWSAAAEDYSRSSSLGSGLSRGVSEVISCPTMDVHAVILQ